MAVEKEIKRSDLRVLVKLQSDELRKKNVVIAEMEALLEEQALQLSQSRRELNICREQLGMSLAV